MPGDDPDLLEVLAVEVQLHVPEAVDVEHGRVDAALSPTSGCGRSSRASASGSIGGPELGERDAEREVRRGGREQIAAVERPRDGLERVLGVRELVRLGDAAEPLGRGHEQAVVGPDVQAALAVAQRERRGATPPTPGSTTARWTPSGMYGSVLREDERALQHALRRDPVRDVDDLDVRRDALDHAVAGADEVVLQAEVGQERDDHAAGRYDGRPRRGRRGRASRPRRRRRARARAARGRLRADRDGRRRRAERRVGARGRGRGEHDEVGVRERVGPKLARPVERHEVGAELVGEQAPRALGAGEEHAARRARKLGQQALLRRDRRDEVGSSRARERLGRPGPDRGDAAAASPRIRRASSRAPFGLVTTTQS